MEQVKEYISFSWLNIGPTTTQDGLVASSTTRDETVASCNPQGMKIARSSLGQINIYCYIAGVFSATARPFIG